jgi:hypothetical protein
MRYAFAFALLCTLAVWTARSSDDISLLRSGGQASVDALHAQLPQIDEARLDQVCGQRDCAASRLFWYTDLEEAKAAAKRLRRPILSLHLLGRLDEEVSCANSRFFRVLLYSDPQIASVLRDEFVLHWKSVRPVPRITIDLGNGKTIRQTITGNSVHYLLDSDGAPLDALPGLYSPREFRARLQEWTDLYTRLDQTTLAQYHQARASSLRQRAAELRILGASELRELPDRPSAVDAGKRAQSKVALEAPVLRQLALGAGVWQPSQVAELGLQYGPQVLFSEPSLELMRRKQKVTSALLTNLQRTVAADTFFNEYELHRRIHEWFSRGDVDTLQALDERVYEELFLTPADDPWLGLNPDAVFAALKD